MKHFLQSAGAGLALMTAALTPGTAAAEPPEPVYELRIYVTNEGKLPDLMKRFRDHTCSLFEKHGITNVGYWVPMDKENGADNTLIYVLSHKDRETAKASYKAFGADPEWQKAREASEANGKILAKPPESVFMTRTAFSPLLKVAQSASPRVFELRTYITHPGKLPALHERFTNHTVKLFEKHGMTNVCYWTPVEQENKLVYILAHASKEAGMASFTAFRADPVWIAAKGESEKDGSLTVPQPEGVQSIYMKAVDFSPMK